MIYLYTGSNGSAKTLNAIKFICEKLDPTQSRQKVGFLDLIKAKFIQ